MKVLVLGANGATGFQAVRQLIEHGIQVRIIARNIDTFSSLQKQKSLEIIHADILGISDTDFTEHVKGIDAVISCLGHTISFKGIFGKPRRLVTDAIIKTCVAIKKNYPKQKTKLILMNTTACINSEINEKLTFFEKAMMTVMRLILPPHRDNELAVMYLTQSIGNNDETIEWTAVRPDTLINEDLATNYRIYTSPVRSPVFNAGRTSRINVANFMTNLLLNEKLWNDWKYRMPVIYNED